MQSPLFGFFCVLFLIAFETSGRHSSVQYEMTCSGAKLIPYNRITVRSVHQAMQSFHILSNGESKVSNQAATAKDWDEMKNEVFAIIATHEES